MKILNYYQLDTFMFKLNYSLYKFLNLEDFTFGRDIITLKYANIDFWGPF